MRRRHGKHRIARIDDRRSRGIHVQHRHLQKRHVQQDRQKAHQRKIAVVRAREADVSLFQVLQGERQQSDRADEHALDRHLHGRKRVAQSLEHNLRRGIEHRGKQDIEISPFPISRHLLPPVPRLWRSSIIVCPAVLKCNPNPLYSDEKCRPESGRHFDCGTENYLAVCAAFLFSHLVTHSAQEISPVMFRQVRPMSKRRSMP